MPRQREVTRMLIDFARELVDLVLMIKGYHVDMRDGDTSHLSDDDRSIVRGAIAEFGAMMRGCAYTLGHVYCTAPDTVGARDWHNACENIRTTVYTVCVGYDDHNIGTRRVRSMLWIKAESQLSTLRAPAYA